MQQEKYYSYSSTSLKPSGNAVSLRDNIWHMQTLLLSILTVLNEMKKLRLTSRRIKLLEDLAVKWEVYCSVSRSLDFEVDVFRTNCITRHSPRLYSARAERLSVSMMVTKVVSLWLTKAPRNVDNVMTGIATVASRLGPCPHHDDASSKELEGFIDVRLSQSYTY